MNRKTITYQRVLEHIKNIYSDPYAVGIAVKTMVIRMPDVTTEDDVVRIKKITWNGFEDISKEMVCCDKKTARVSKGSQDT